MRRLFCSLNILEGKEKHGYLEYYEKRVCESGLPHKVVYLDQKCWIELAKIYYYKQTKQESKLIGKILEAFEKNEVIFPLSVSHLEETMKIFNTRRKNELVSLMIRLSRGYSFQPYVSFNIRKEIQNIVLKKLGLPQKNIRNSILKQGISNLVGGGKPTLAFRKGAKGSELPENFKKGTLGFTRESRSFRILFQVKTTKIILK